LLEKVGCSSVETVSSRENPIAFSVVVVVAVGVWNTARTEKNRKRKRRKKTNQKNRKTKKNPTNNRYAVVPSADENPTDNRYAVLPSTVSVQCNSWMFRLLSSPDSLEKAFFWQMGSSSGKLR
jgi:hypothetical protein